MCGWQWDLFDDTQVMQSSHMVPKSWWANHNESMFAPSLLGCNMCVSIIGHAWHTTSSPTVVPIVKHFVVDVFVHAEDGIWTCTGIICESLVRKVRMYLWTTDGGDLL